MNLINKYQNGPVTVEIYDNGTKIREWDDEKYGIEPELEFAESLDVKITNFCDMNCAFCHEKSSISGKHGNLAKFMGIIEISNLPKGVEMAIGGGNPLDHPDITTFLNYCKEKGLIINMTVNLNHLCKENYQTQMIQYIDQQLVRGIGISITNNTFINKELLHISQKTVERIKKKLKIKARKWLQENKDNYIIDIEGETIVDAKIIEDFFKAMEEEIKQIIKD